MNARKVLAFFFLILFPSVSSFAYWVWSPEKGEFVNPEGNGQGNAEEQYEYAIKFYKEKNLDEAVKQLDGLLKKYPTAPIAPEARYRLGTIYEEKNEYVKAFGAYKNLVENYPQSERFNEVIEREFRIGNLFLSGKKGKLMGLEILPSSPKAIEIFEHIVKFAPYGEFGDKAQFHLGLALKQSGKFEEAVAAFQTLIDQYPQSELVPQAKFQVAETAFDRSSREFRDQRALDEAGKQVDRFLEQYPDTTTSEKAAKLRQMIDEKNAEKNFRIALYYEKDNYLESALIYYSDVSTRYPQTEWGQKAAEKLKVLKNPSAYHSGKDKEILDEMEIVESQLKSLQAGDNEERKRLEQRLERLKKQRASLGKEEREGVKSRAQDLKRREGELKEKFKRLEEKKKLMKNNPSEDFKRAIERWHASLVEEQETLAAERKQLEEWQKNLGMGFGQSPWEFLPFWRQPPSELEKIRQMDAKKLYKISSEKKPLLEDKENLYKRYAEIQAALGPLPATQVEEVVPPEENPEWKKLVDSAGDNFKPQQKKLTDTYQQIMQLRSDMTAKRFLYEKHYGSPSWLKSASLPARKGSVGKSFSFLNPFGRDEGNLDGKNLQELAEFQMHVQEQIAAQQSLTDTLSQAFDTELALQEQKRLLESFGGQEKIDPAELRKSIKALERNIRTSYQEIQDRHQKKKELLEELDRLLKNEEAQAGILKKTGRAIASPAVFFYRFQKAFLFGMKTKDEKINQSAKGAAKDLPDADQVRQLQEQVELESLLIEAKNEEIGKYQKELEILKAKASLAGGFKFRSAFVEVPYRFIGEALESAKKIVPRKAREEILIERLDEETAKLEQLRSQLKEVEKRMEEETAKAKAPEKTSKTESGETKQASEPGGQAEALPTEPVLKGQIQNLMEQLEIKRNIFEREKAILESQLGTVGKEVKKEEPKKPAEESEKNLNANRSKNTQELKTVREELTKIIQTEDRLEGEEAGLLEKKIEAVDRVVSGVHSKAVQQDLLTEKERMEERVSQIKSRRAFLSKELERFQTIQHEAIP